MIGTLMPDSPPGNLFGPIPDMVTFAVGMLLLLVVFYIIDRISRRASIVALLVLVIGMWQFQWRNIRWSDHWNYLTSDQPSQDYDQMKNRDPVGLPDG